MGKKFELSAEKNERVVTFLAASVPGLSRAKADILVKSGEVKVNGLRVKSNRELAVGDSVTVFVPDGVNAKSNIGIVYEDKNIVVFDKPKRMPYDAMPEIYGEPIFAVHRLDTNTTGLIVFAKNQSALKELESAFRDRRVKKVYEAVVYPAPDKNSDILTAYTKLMPSQGMALVSATQRSGYKTMVTEYSVTKRIGNAAVLRVVPHTGRTHQIRAHLCFIGCPIVGEHKYGIRGNNVSGAPDTQMLAAVELTFEGLDGKLRYLNGKTFFSDSKFDLGFLYD